MTAATDEEELELKARRARDAQAQAEGDFRAVMALPAGRRFLQALIYGRCNILGSSDGALLEGRRSIGTELLLDAQRLARREYLLMVQEALEAQAMEPPEN